MSFHIYRLDSRPSSGSVEIRVDQSGLRHAGARHFGNGDGRNPNRDWDRGQGDGETGETTVPDETNEKPTIYTIAKLAGVSHTTVSRALNGHPKVSPEQRKRIEAIASRLGYAGPNRHALALRTKRSQMVGVLLM